MNRKRKRRQILFDRDPHCHWCGVLTVWYSQPTKHEEMPNNAATLDHLYSRFNPERITPIDNVERTVLACLECNRRRSVEEEAKIHGKALN